MAELSARIIAKASGTTSEEPLAADLEVAELAVNTADGKLFTKHTDGTIVTISGGGSARTTSAVTTSSLADGASENMTASDTGKAGQLLAIETDQASWVTVYTSQAARTSDSSRAETTDPAPGSGVIAEVITTGSQRVAVTPCTSFFNDEGTPASDLYLKIVNKSGSAQVVTVTLTVVATEI